MCWHPAESTGLPVNQGGTANRNDSSLIKQNALSRTFCFSGKDFGSWLKIKNAPLLKKGDVSYD